MTIWYIDPTNGTDVSASAGVGDSFATRRKRINNIVAAASAPGDTIRVMASPDPTSLGVNGTWTTGPYSTTQAPTGSTATTPIVFTKIGHGLVTGDTIIISGHTVNTNANGTWDVTVSGNTFTLFNANGSNSIGNGTGTTSGLFRKITSCRVNLASALTKNVALIGNQGAKVNWTPSANVTAALSTTDFKEGFGSQTVTIAAAFTTGLAAYYPLGAATDFSAYQQITFWIKQTSGTLGLAGSTTLTLCSDTAGATAVDTFTIPALGALNRWMPVTVDKGSALGASIQSVAFNVITDNAAQTFLIDNIQASKSSASADSLSLQSLITKNTTGEVAFAIQSINSSRVMLEQETNTTPLASPARGYFGTTETVLTYKREAFKTTAGTTVSTSTQAMTESGTAGSLITVSGGWDSTAMTAQSAQTWFDGLNGYNYGLSTGAFTYIALDSLAFVRYYRGISCISSNLTISLINAGHNTTANIFVSGASNQSSIPYSYNAGGTGVDAGSSTGGSFTVGKAYGSDTVGLDLTLCVAVSAFATEINGSGTMAIDFTSASETTAVASLLSNSGTYGANFTGSTDCRLYDATISGSTTASVKTSNTGSLKSYLIRCTLSDTTPVVARTANASNSGGLFSHSQDGNALNHQQYMNNGTTSSEATIRHTASGISWKLSPSLATYTTALSPYYMPIAKVACASGTLVTASVWMYRTNTGLTARLMCKGLQILGVSSDVSTAMTAIANTWEQVTITFTPTEIGVVELLAECWGGTTYSLYVDDFSVSQA